MQDKRRLLIETARSCIGISAYQGSAQLSEAPRKVNCYRFIQWLFHYCVGIALPDHLLAWHGALTIPIRSIAAGDLVFVPLLNRTLATDDFGHVGMVTDTEKVIHANKLSKTVTEDPLAQFLERGCLGARRIAL